MRTGTGPAHPRRNHDAQDRRGHQPDARRRDAGAGPARRGPPRRLRARRLGGRRTTTRSWARPWARGWPGRGPLLFGRRTYEDFFKVWPGRTDNPFTEVLDNAQKYVASQDAAGAAAVEELHAARGDAAEAVARLKEQPGKDIVVLGSGDLVQSLMRHGLVDDVRAADPSAGPGPGPPAVRRRRAALERFRLVDACRRPPAS